MAEPKRLLVSGYYGFGNTGDEAILEVVLARLSEAHPDAQVTVVSGRPADTEIDHDVAAVHWQDIPAIVDAAERADLLVLGGGGLFQDYWPCRPENMLTAEHGNLDNWAGFALLARMVDTPLMVYAVGVGPLTSDQGRRCARLAFDQASAITVRDEASRRLLADIGVDPSRVEVSADPSFLLDAAPPQRVDEILAASGLALEGDVRIGVALRPWTDAPDGWAEQIAEALDQIVADHGADILFLPFQRSVDALENDTRAAAEVRERMRHVDRATILRAELTPQEILAVLGTCDLAVAVRLHSAIFATRMAVPTVAISYDPKVTQLMADVGLDEYTLALDRLEAADLVERAGRALGEAPRIRHQLTERVEILRERATRSGQLLERLIAGEIGPPPDPTPDTVAAMSRLVLARSAERHRMRDIAVQFEREQREHRREQQEHREARKRIDELLDDRTELLHSRAFQLARTYWKVRALPSSIRDFFAETPERARRVTRRIVPRKARRRARDAFAAAGEKRRREEVQRTEDEIRRLREDIAAQLGDVLAANSERRGVVVFPPTIGWQVSLFQRPQQMALAFAQAGYLVLYHLSDDNAEGVMGFEGQYPGMYLAHVPDDVIDVLRDVPEPIVLTYVYNFGWSRHLDSPVVVYEHIDDLEVFTSSFALGDLHAWHEEALAKADVLVASAVDLHRELIEVRGDALLCPNGVDYDHFASYRPSAADDTPADLAPIVAKGRPVVGYYGALAEWIDYQLIEATARELPECEFVFIGPDYDGSLAKAGAFELANVSWLGVKGYNALPAYLHRFDVATIPFVVNDVTHSVSPIKLFEYMAGGRPVVTTALRECERYPVVLIGRDPADYVDKLRHGVSLRHDREHQRRLRRTARDNTWGQRVGAIIDAVAEARAARS